MNALNAYNKLNTNVAGFKKSSEKLSSGYRINRAGDDAAGLAISEKMRSQIRGLNQAKRNSQDGISMIQTYEGAAQESHNILQRMKELATQSANGTYQNEVDRDAIQLEFDQLNDELNQIADTDFNGTVMLNGGQMADGTKAANGKFDYANSERAAQQIGSAGGMLIGIGTDANTTTDATAGTVTFTATKFDDGSVCWQGNNGEKGTEGAGVVAPNAQPTNTNAKTGGFIYNGVSVNIDTTQVVTGDTITIKFSAPQTATGKKSEVTGSTTDWGSTTKGTSCTPASITMSNTAPTSQEIADAMNYLNKVTVEQTWSANAVAGTAGDVDQDSTKINGKLIDVSAANKETNLVTYADGSKIDYKVNAANAVAGKFIFTDKNGNATELASFTSGADAGSAAGAVITGKGAVTTTIYTSKASFTPAAGSGVELIEPSGKVSQSNSNNAATAPLTYTDHLVLQSGARTKDSVDFTFSYNTDGMGELKANMDISARAGGLNTANLSLKTQEDANAAIDQIDNAINKVSMVRATFGATQNRLEHKVENLTTTAENLTEAEAGIRDTDMASEMMNYTKFNILQQAAQSMLAQANQQPQSILQLLG